MALKIYVSYIQLSVSQKSGGASNCNRIVLSSDAASQHFSGVTAPSAASRLASTSSGERSSLQKAPSVFEMDLTRS